MTTRNIDDEMLLMDFVTGNCDQVQRQAVTRRLQDDEAFRLHHDDIASTMAALKLAADVDPPANLAASTMARIRQKRQTDALLAREDAMRSPGPVIFSLRELAAAVAVVAVLTLVMVPSFRQAGQLAGRGLCDAQLGQIGAALGLYANSNDDYLPTADAADSQWLPSPFKPNTSNSRGLFKLIAGGYSGPGAFRCPACFDETGEDQEAGVFPVVAGMCDFPKGDYVTYSYQHSISPFALRRSDQTVASVASSMAILADSNPMFIHGQFQPDRISRPVSDNHGGQGQNVLYLDMHVDWARTAGAGVRGNNIYLAEGIFHYEGNELPTGPTDTFLLPAFSPQE